MKVTIEVEDNYGEIHVSYSHNEYRIETDLSGSLVIFGDDDIEGLIDLLVSVRDKVREITQ